MRQTLQADVTSRRVDEVDGSAVDGLNAALAWLGVAGLVAAIAFILGSTLLT
jgi:hypothetical protein